MLLLEQFPVSFEHCKVSTEIFPNCKNLIRYLIKRGINDTVLLKEYPTILYESFLSDCEINLFLMRFYNLGLRHKKLNQVDITEFIVEYFFPYGLDIMKATEVQKFYVLTSKYFNGYFLYQTQLLNTGIISSHGMFSALKLMNPYRKLNIIELHLIKNLGGKINIKNY